MIRSILTMGTLLFVVAHCEAGSTPLELKVKKTTVVNSRDEPIRLRGVNTACLEWTSDGEGHILDSVKTAIKDWHVNVIRLPLAQDRWFGKAREQKDDGKAYRALVDAVVKVCADEGCYVILDLHWSDAGEWGKQIGQHVMPDQNSVEFWKSCATAYTNHPAVIFDLYNEPHDVSWDVWSKGGKVTEKAFRRNPQKTYQAVGMQALLDTVRATGAKNVVIAGGLDWAYDMSGFLDGKQLADPTGNGVIYANHTYPFKGDTVERWIAKMEKASKVIPIIVGEFGAESRGPGVTKGQTGEQWVRRVLQALEDHSWSWTAWDLHPAAGPRLISDWKYTPTPSFGTWVKQALLGTLPPYTPPPAAAAPASAAAAPALIGIFENHEDVGTVLHPGSVSIRRGQTELHARRQRREHVVHAGCLSLRVEEGRRRPRSGGRHLLCRRRPGTASQGVPGDPPRVCEADSAYVDAALHGDGLTSLQFREARGAATHEVQANVSAPGACASRSGANTW